MLSLLSSKSKAAQSYRNIVERAQSKLVDRDRAMLDVFMLFYKPQKRYFIHAHLGHPQKCEFWDIKWFGYYLSGKFGAKYFAIGNAFYDGIYTPDNTPPVLQVRISLKVVLLVA